MRTLAVLFIVGGAGHGQTHASGAEVVFSQGAGGAVAVHTVAPGESLVELARRYDVGFNEITAANPRIDPFIPAVGTPVTIPGSALLPDVPVHSGIVVNLAEMRLYSFPPRAGDAVDTFPVGIGDEGWDTPTGTYTIIQKIADPAWHVPPSIRRQRPELPPVVPPGPDNPLGARALRLSLGTVLIHGTNHPYGIGRKVSHGCIHLYPEDIDRLFRKVSVGTRVTIVRQPVKAAVVNGRLLVEVHDEAGCDLEQEVIDLLAEKALLARADLAKLAAAAKARSGMPTDITRT
ncbi:hypothetical protein AOG2_01570 [Geobacter sp. AOG2]|nr:hypothetical protein AOG2_01570 [Geobacter sp. AOG2]